MIIAEVLQSVDKVTTIIKRAGVSMSSDAFWGVLGTLLGTIIGYLLSEMHNHAYDSFAIGPAKEAASCCKYHMPLYGKHRLQGV